MICHHLLQGQRNDTHGSTAADCLQSLLPCSSTLLPSVLLPSHRSSLPLSLSLHGAVMCHQLLLTDTTKMEEAVVSHRVLQNLHERGITVARFYCGHYMTALDMAGLSVTIMR
jgi:hypothetical protein